MMSSQKSLTRIVTILALSGSLTIGLLWWDSTRYSTLWLKNEKLVASSRSSIGVQGRVSLADGTEGFKRTRLDPPGEIIPNFIPRLNSGSFFWLVIPYYLILLTYLSALLLTWLILMNRLARREMKKA